jgi:hypothetical protein
MIRLRNRSLDGTLLQGRILSILPEVDIVVEGAFIVKGVDMCLLGDALGVVHLETT